MNTYYLNLGKKWRIISFGIAVWLLCAFQILCAQYFPIATLHGVYDPWIVTPQFVPGQIVLQFFPGVTLEQIRIFYLNYGLTEIAFNPISGIKVVVGPPGVPIENIIPLLNASPIVVYAEPNYIGRTAYIPNDIYFPYQWHLSAINMQQAWDLSTGAGVIVAILDTGVAFENNGIYAQAPDLSGTSFIAGWDFVNGDAFPDDDAGHGTHMAGTIAQTTGNILGCAGIAFNSTIMPVKVMDSDGSGTLTDIVNGIYFAVNNGAQLINMSLGFGDNPTVSLEDAVNYAYDNGVTIICSGGNSGTSELNYPAAYPPCIAVSGVRYDLTIADYSNYGPYIDICAPGGDLSVDQNLDGYPDGILQQSHDGVNFQSFDFYLGRGSSWAAACVTGVAALIQSYAGGILTPLEITDILTSTAIDMGAPGWDQYYGWGVVNAYDALLATPVAAVAAAGLLRFAFSPQPIIPPLLPLMEVTTGNSPVATIHSSDLSPFVQEAPSDFFLSSSSVNPFSWFSPIPYSNWYSTSIFPNLNPWAIFQTPGPYIFF
ncbi:MAG: S8 family peptidase [bacterium]